MHGTSPLDDLGSTTRVLKRLDPIKVARVSIVLEVFSGKEVADVVTLFAGRT